MLKTEPYSTEDRTPILVQGDVLAKYLKQAGLTHEEAARQIGVSYNTFRNAFRKNRRVRRQLILDVIIVLEQHGVTADLEELDADSSLRCVAEDLYRMYHDSVGFFEKLDIVRRHISPQVVMTVHGDPRFIPFAGEYRGYMGLRAYEAAFKRTVELLDDGFGTTGRVLVDDVANVVVFLCEDSRIRIRSSGQVLQGPVRTTFDYRDRKVVRMTALFDTGSLYPVDLVQTESRGSRIKDFIGKVCGRPKQQPQIGDQAAQDGSPPADGRDGSD